MNVTWFFVGFASAFGVSALGVFVICAAAMTPAKRTVESARISLRNIADNKSSVANPFPTNDGGVESVPAADIAQ